MQRKIRNWKTFCVLLAIEQRQKNHNKSIGLTPSPEASDHLDEGILTECVLDNEAAIKGLRLLRMMESQFPNDRLIKEHIRRLENSC
jgi:hypothetical protein